MSSRVGGWRAEVVALFAPSSRRVLGLGVTACVLSGAPWARAEPAVASFPVDSASAPPSSPASSSSAAPSTASEPQSEPSRSASSDPSAAKGAPHSASNPPASLASNPPASVARRRSGIQSGNVQLSGEERHLFGIRVTGVGFRGALGGADSETRPFMPSVFAGGLVGQTRAGLGFDRVDVGAELDGRTRYLHAGIGLGLGYLWIARTTGGSPMGSVLEFAELHAGPELPLGDHFALALDARLAVDAVFGHDTTLMLGPGIGLRLRYY